MNKLSIPNELVSEIKKVIPNIQEEKIPDIINVISHSVEVRSVGKIFSGPLPAPEILQGYENILTGSAERIIKMTENQAHHRQNCEKKLLKLILKMKPGEVFLLF